jgi:hypothetical protein
MLSVHFFQISGKNFVFYKTISEQNKGESQQKYFNNKIGEHGATISSITAFSIMTVGKTTLNIFNTVSITILSVTIKTRYLILKTILYAECSLCWVLLMLSVVYAGCC